METLASVLKPQSAAQCLYNTRLKYFGDEFTKITCFSKPVFNPHGVEKHKKFKYEDKAQKDFEKQLNDYYAQLNKDDTTQVDSQDTRKEKRTDAVKRAKDKVFEIAFANDFQYFITLTLDKEKISRTNKDEIIHALNIWLQNLVARCGFMYVLCPEYHEDEQAIHFHGLCSGSLKLVDSGTVLVDNFKKPIHVDKAQRMGFTGRTVYNLENWKYGFSTVLELDNQKERVALYVTKYIVKDSDKIIGRYYYSGGKGLVRQVPTEYQNYPYSEFNGNEITILPNCLAVKYKTL